MPKITRRKAIHLTLAGAATAFTSPHGLPAQETNAKDAELEALIARIEGPQSPNQQKPDPHKLNQLTLQEVMKKVEVPGVSVAVIKDFKIHWAMNAPPQRLRLASHPPPLRATSPAFPQCPPCLRVEKLLNK